MRLNNYYLYVYQRSKDTWETVRKVYISGSLSPVYPDGSDVEGKAKGTLCCALHYSKCNFGNISEPGCAGQATGKGKQTSWFDNHPVQQSRSELRRV